MSKSGKKRKAGDASKTSNISNAYFEEVKEFNSTIGELFLGPDEERFEKMVRIDVVGQFYCKKYAWAVPDARSLRIVTSFSPIIELGCGNAYWSSLLRKAGCDVIAVDKYSSENDDQPFIDDVIKGDAAYLKKKSAAGRTLFLCYPDDRESLSAECLKYYQGDTIIHVGELAFLGGTYAGGEEQCPFGRTTCSEFQVELAAQFHCVLNAKLKCLPHCNDYISVWKRSAFVSMGEDFQEWKAIPKEEALPDLDLAAPAFKHLL